jgi:hypothetical protein
MTGAVAIGVAWAWHSGAANYVMAAGEVLALAICRAAAIPLDIKYDAGVNEHRKFLAAMPANWGVCDAHDGFEISIYATYTPLGGGDGGGGGGSGGIGRLMNLVFT